MLYQLSHVRVRSQPSKAADLVTTRTTTTRTTTTRTTATRTTATTHVGATEPAIPDVLPAGVPEATLAALARLEHL